MSLSNSTPDFRSGPESCLSSAIDCSIHRLNTHDPRLTVDSRLPFLGGFWHSPHSRGISDLNHLSDLILHYRLENLPAVLLALKQGFTEFYELLGVDVTRQWRLIRIDHGLNDCGPIVRQGEAQGLFCLLRLLNRETCGTAVHRDSGKIDRLQIHAEFRIPFEDHLLPLDLTQRVIFDDDDFDIEVVLNQGSEFAHQHRQAPIADNANHLPVGIGNGWPDAVGEDVGHGRERSGKGELHAIADLDITGGPGCDRTAVCRHDRVWL